MAIRVELELSDGRFTTRMLRAGETLKQFNDAVIASDKQLRKFAGTGHLAVQSISRLDTHSRSFLSTMRDVTIVFGLARAAIQNIHAVSTGWAGEIIKVNAQFERMTELMRGMSTASNPLKEAQREVRQLREEALNTPFSLNAITDAAVKMKSTGLDPMNGSLRSILDGVAAFAGTDQHLQRVGIALSQMSGKGVIQMEELRQQLGEAIPQAMQLMARGAGVSVSELIKKISTGTVEAKHALKQLFSELDRSFGGQALEKMATFQGMLKRTETLFQTLALKAGEAGYFEAVKTQLGDINAFLGSDMAGRYAQRIGSMLTRTVNGIRSVVDAMVAWKDEIQLVGLALAGIFTTRLIAGAFSTIVSTLAAIRTQMSAVRVEAALAATQMRAAFSAKFAASIGASTDAVDRLRLAVRGVTGGFAALVRGLAVFGPAIGFAAIGTYELIKYFSLFNDEIQSSIDKLDEFGGATKENIEDAVEAIKKAKEQLEELKAARAEIENAKALSTDRGIIRPQFDEALAANDRSQAALQAQIDELSKAKDQAVLEHADLAARRLAEQRERQMRADIADRRRAYREEIELAQQKYSKELEEAQDGTRSLTEVQERNREEMTRIQVRMHEDEIAIIRQRIAAAKREIAAAGAEEAKALQVHLDRLNTIYGEALDKKAQFLELGSGIFTNPQVADQEAAYQRGTAALQKLQSELVGLRAELQGGNADVIELQDAINNGKYGEIEGVERVEELRNRLVETKDEVEKLKEALSGKAKFERDLSNAEIKVQEEIFKLKHGNVSESEKIWIKWREGAYGMGATKGGIDKLLGDVQRQFGNTGEAANEAGKAMKTGPFGNETRTAGQRLIEMVQKLNGEWTGFRQNVEGTRPGAAFGRVSGGLDYQNAGGNYLDTLIGRESGGRANARASTSSAVGLGQFIESTWMQFLNDAHPELDNATTEFRLGLRENATMMREAIQWYAGENAKHLQSRGQDPNDANLYLAHLLGPDGAVTLLQSSMMRMVKDVLPAAAKANKFMQSMSVGDLVRQVREQFGTGYSALGQPTNPQTAQQPIEMAPITVRPDSSDIDEGSMIEAGEKRLAKLKKLEAEKAKLQLDADLTEETEKFSDALDKATDKTDGLRTNYEKAVRMIQSGKLGPSDITLDRYKNFLKIAKEADEQIASTASAKEARSNFESLAGDLERYERSLGQARVNIKEDVSRQVRNINSFEKQEMVRKLDEYVAAARRGYGQDSEQFRQAVARKQQILKQSGSTEQSIIMHNLGVKETALRQGMMTEKQLNEVRIQDYRRAAIAELDAHNVYGDARVEAEARIQENIRLMREQTAQQSPLRKQMTEWADFGGNMEKAATGWMDSLTSTMADFITTGKADFKGLINSVIKDMTKLALNWAFSQIMGGGKGGQGGLKSVLGGGGMGGGGAKGGGASKAVRTAMKAGSGGLFHTGGIVGAERPGSRMVSSLAFSGAPRFHTGGVISGLGIGPDEVPIIAKKGEGVFTREQMRAMGGMAQSANGARKMDFNANIKVEGGGGTSDQNTDLAAKIGQQIEPRIRALVVSEMREQQRPGNLLNRG